jgi:hypothetical protein
MKKVYSKVDVVMELCSKLVVTSSSPIYLKTSRNQTIFHVESSSAVTGQISMRKKFIQKLMW